MAATAARALISRRSVWPTVSAALAANTRRRLLASVCVHAKTNHYTSIWVRKRRRQGGAEHTPGRHLTALPITAPRTAKAAEDSVTQSQRTPLDCGCVPSTAMSLVRPSKMPSCPLPLCDALKGGASRENLPQSAEVASELQARRA